MSVVRWPANRRKLAVTVGAAAVFALIIGLLATRDGGESDRAASEPPGDLPADDVGAPRQAGDSTSTTTTIAPTTTVAAPVSSTTSPPATPAAPATTEPPATTGPPATSLPPPPPSTVPLAVRDGRFIVDGEARAMVGVNASGAASALMLGSPCGWPDVDLDLMFSVLPERSLVRVWFTQRMATNIVTLERNWAPIDAVVQAAARSPSRPLLLVTLATGSGDCDGGGWRNRSWYEGGYRDVEPGMPNSYAGWVDEIVSRYATSDSVAVWEPVNEPDPSTCLPGHQGSGCFGHTRCDPGAAEALATFLSDVGGRIKALDPAGLVSNGGGGWCGWYSKPERLVIESAPNVDIISVHDYHMDDQAVPDWMWETFERARTVNKPLLVGEVGIGAGANGGGRSYPDRAELLAAKVQEQINGGADAVLLWVYGGFDDCGYCIAPDDPVIPRLAAMTLR